MLKPLVRWFEENRRLHKAIIEGVPVDFYGADGVLRGDKVRLVDFDDAGANDCITKPVDTTEFLAILASWLPAARPRP